MSDPQPLDLGALFELLESGDPPDTARIAALLGSSDPLLIGQVGSIATRLQRLGRRDRELTALMASIHDLLEVHDVQGVLNRLVDRAHDLIGTDVTYMSVYVPQSHELFVRAARGIVTASFLGMRVPAGIGIASRVVQDVAPHWTADYWRDREISHDPQIDTILEQERLRSLLGVPVAAGGDVLGVLFAADREVHSFGTEQIALLSAFADQAAVILRTARLFAEATQAARDAQDRADAMASAARVHTRLTDVVLAGHSPDQVAATLGESLGRVVAVTDGGLGAPRESDGSATSGWWVGGRAAPALVAAVKQSSTSGRCARVEGIDGVDVAAAALSGTAVLGAVFVGSGDQPLSDIERRTVERSAQILALLTMQREAMSDAEERVRGELAHDLLSGRAGTDAVRRRAHARHIALDEPWTVAALAVPAEHRHAVMRQFSSYEGWLATLHQDGVSLLVPGSAAPEMPGAPNSDRAEDVAERIRIGLPGPAVHSRWVLASASDADAITGALAEAWDCATLLDGLHATSGAHHVADYTPFLALFGTDAARARAYIDRMIGSLVEWDRSHHSELVRTLCAFIDAESSATRAARSLIVHPNTVKQRLERIALLLGHGWREPERLFRIGVAARLHQAAS